MEIVLTCLETTVKVSCQFTGSAGLLSLTGESTTCSDSGLTSSTFEIRRALDIKFLSLWAGKDTGSNSEQSHDGQIVETEGSI